MVLIVGSNRITCTMWLKCHVTCQKFAVYRQLPSYMLLVHFSDQENIRIIQVKYVLLIIFIFHHYCQLSIFYLWILTYSTCFIFFLNFLIITGMSSVTIYQTKFLVCVKLLGNKPDSDYFTFSCLYHNLPYCKP